MSPKRFLNADLSYLPKCTELVFSYRFQKTKLKAMQQVLYRGGLTGKF